MDIRKKIYEIEKEWGKLIRLFVVLSAFTFGMLFGTKQPERDDVAVLEACVEGQVYLIWDKSFAGIKTVKTICR